MRIKIGADLALGFSKTKLTELGKLGKTNWSTWYQVVLIGQLGTKWYRSVLLGKLGKTNRYGVDRARRTQYRAVLVGECEVLVLP